MDFIRLGSLAGYRKIQTVTNGRLFAYQEFLDKCVEAGLSEITFSLHGPNARIHDALVGVKGAFEQESAGLRRALDDGRPIVNVDIVINRGNVKALPEMLELFYGWGVREFDLLQVVPFGRAFTEGRDTLFYDLEEAAPYIRQALEFSQRPDVHVWLNRFPPPHLEGFEHLIQDPYKLNDEVRGRKEEFARQLEHGEPLDCRDPHRCRYCYPRAALRSARGRAGHDARAPLRARPLRHRVGGLHAAGLRRRPRLGAPRQRRGRPSPPAGDGLDRYARAPAPRGARAARGRDALRREGARSRRRARRARALRGRGRGGARARRLRRARGGPRRRSPAGRGAPGARHGLDARGGRAAARHRRGLRGRGAALPRDERVAGGALRGAGAAQPAPAHLRAAHRGLGARPGSPPPSSRASATRSRWRASRSASSAARRASRPARSTRR
ncbi:MAG: radical SAM protein [Sandaracinaceae bacterium]|nr:radical SAM protein [Sandaracinaceae bacterium]